MTTTYTWDSLNRLTGATDTTGLAANYQYNGDALRTRATVNGVTTSFTWDPTGLGTVLSDGDQYVWGQGLVGRIDASGTATWAHADGLGSVRLVTDGAGAVVGTSAYDAFGAARTATGVQYRFGFTGEQQDGETGFVYLRARSLDPGQGRFVSRDPFAGWLALPGSLHDYGYVRNNPLNALDPSGLNEFTDKDYGGGGPPVFVGKPVLGRYQIPGNPGNITTTPAPGAIAPYTVAARGMFKLRCGLPAGEAHHILERRFLVQWGYNPNHGPSVVLSKEEHRIVTQMLREALPYGKTRYSREEVWAAYQDVYTRLGHPDWLQAIEGYFP